MSSAFLTFGIAAYRRSNSSRVSLSPAWRTGALRDVVMNGAMPGSGTPGAEFIRNSTCDRGLRLWPHEPQPRGGALRKELQPLPPALSLLRRGLELLAVFLQRRHHVLGHALRTLVERREDLLAHARLPEPLQVPRDALECCLALGLRG